MFFVVDILVVVGIMYRGNVLGGTKSVFRCTLYHLKRFLVHGIVTRGQQMVTSPIYIHVVHRAPDTCADRKVWPSAAL